jgi:hypothetical protein
MHRRHKAKKDDAFNAETRKIHKLEWYVIGSICFEAFPSPVILPEDACYPG